MSKFDPKKLIAAAKKRWPLVAAGAAALLGTPALVYFAMDKGASDFATFEKDVQAAASDFNNPSIKYDLPAVTPGGQAIEWTGAPNEVAIARFKEARDFQAKGLAGVSQAAIEFNKAGHAPFIEGLLPDPPAGDQVRAKEMGRKMSGALQMDVLKVMNAGSPIDPQLLRGQISDRRRELLAAEFGSDAAAREGELTEAQNNKIREALLAYRIGQYQRRAERIGVYADESALPAIGFKEEQTPAMTEVWSWHKMMWAIKDVARAVAKANEAAKNLGVPAAVVKRVEKLQLAEGSAQSQPAPGGPMDPSGGAMGGAAPAGPTEQTPNFSVSLTGRTNGPIFDVLKLNLVAVVSTRDLPQLINAIGQTNYMTVTDVDLSAVDVVADLRQGFYYGDDHVSRVSMTIEVLMLRAWTEPLMPKSVKVGLGLVPPDAAVDPNAGGIPPAQPGAPTGGPGGGRRPVNAGN